MDIKIDKKKAKNIGIWILSLILVFYIILLLILPNVINLDKYKSDIQKVVYNNCKLNLDYSKAKIVTSPIFSVGIRLKDVKISYPDKTNIISTDLAEAKVAVLPLIFKTIVIDSVKIKSPQINLDILPDDRLKIEKYLADNIAQTSDKTDSQQSFGFGIKLNKLKISDYNVIFKDSKDALAIKGENLIVSKFILNEHAKIKTEGAILLNNKKNITYDLDIDTYLPDMSKLTNKKQQTNTPFIFNPVKAFKTYNLKLDANSKIKIRNKNGLDIKGFADIENAKFSLPNKTL